MRTPAVEIRGLGVELDGATILRAVDMRVEEGEHLLLVGPSGSGKSTLLRAIAGLVAPERGTIDLCGERASEPGRLLQRPERRGVGFLFQGGALWPHMSVEGTLAFVLRCAGVPRGDRAGRIRELLEQVELTGLEDRMPATLSGGEGQRLALARALAGGPRLLLLDEPLGPLDAELRGELLGRLGALHRGLCCTTIHVTHDPHEAAAIATRTLHMRDGRLLDDDQAR